ncbi:MAG: CBS domain-containing protein [Pirellulaceae bacterium]|jgi:CBS domain-containing protein|nr:CBS domain-containing protein [Pirellulaceae bacterium]
MTGANRQLTAEDIMTGAVLSVSPDDMLHDAVDAILENHISGLPVVDEEGHLAGILTEADRLRVMSDGADMSTARVADYMTCGVVAVDVTTSARQIADILMRTSFRRVPVTRNGRLVGIVSRRDLVAAFHNAKAADSSSESTSGEPAVAGGATRVDE